MVIVVAFIRQPVATDELTVRQLLDAEPDVIVPQDTQRLVTVDREEHDEEVVEGVPSFPWSSLGSMLMEAGQELAVVDVVVVLPVVEHPVATDLLTVLQVAEPDFVPQDTTTLVTVEAEHEDRCDEFGSPSSPCESSGLIDIEAAH